MRYIFLDGGSHLGESVKAFYETTLYAERPDEWEIYCFEAHPDLDHLQLLAEPHRVNFIPKAIWIKDGTIPFYLGQKQNCDGSSLLIEKETGELNKENPIIVHCLDLSTWLMNHFKPTDQIILKLDIEGAEYAVLRKMLADGSLAWLNKLYVELHATKINLPIEEEQTLLDQIKEQYPQLEILIEGDLLAKYSRKLRKSVPGFWFLGESRLVSAQNSSEIYLLKSRMSELERKNEKRLNQLWDKIRRMDNRETEDRQKIKKLEKLIQGIDEKRLVDKEKLATNRTYEKRKMTKKIKKLQDQVNYAVTLREITKLPKEELVENIPEESIVVEANKSSNP